MSLRSAFVRTTLRNATTGALLAALLSAPAGAQYRTLSVNDPIHSVTVNPFFLLAGWISGDYEQRINTSLTAGGGLSYFEYGNTHYTTVEGRATLYPEDHAMRGFGFSGSLGITNVNYEQKQENFVCDRECADPPRKSFASPSFGVEASYQWLLGRTGRTSAIVGLGGTRLLTSKSTLDGTDRVFVTSRLGIGYAW